MLADDHLVVRAGMRHLLSSDSRFSVVAEAHDVTSTLSAVRAFQPALLVLDLTMAGGSVLEAIPALLGAAPGLRILILTMHDDPAFVRAALKAGAHGYLLKDAAGEQLLAALSAVTDGQTYVSPQLGARLVHDPFDELSDREKQVLTLVAAGHTNQEIAGRLYVSLRTVEAHRAHIRQKLGVETRAELSGYARTHGLLR